MGLAITDRDLNRLKVYLEDVLPYAHSVRVSVEDRVEGKPETIDISMANLNGKVDIVKVEKVIKSVGNKLGLKHYVTETGDFLVIKLY